MALVIGLTGGIGCGKSTVARLFQESGAHIIDTDQISHELTGVGGGAIAQIAAQFGAEYIRANGALDRGKMRSAIFSNAEEKRKLESIMHPQILERVRERLLHADTSPYALIVVPLLFNSPVYLKLVQRILVVDCNERLQINRVVQRSGLSEREVLNIISQQTSREERLRRADDVIRNDAGLDELAKKVEELHQAYISRKS